MKHIISFTSRRTLWIYVAIMLGLAAGYAQWDHYTMDGDGTAFLDISQYLVNGHPGLAINGYWNPGYPAVLAVTRSVTHATLWNELAVARYTNILIFAFALGTCLLFTSGLTLLRRQRAASAAHVLPDTTVHLLGLGLLMFSAGRELPLSAVRSDTLLLAFLLLAMGALLRLLAGRGSTWYIVLGAALGCGYLTKSFAFLPSIVLLLALLVAGAVGWTTKITGQSRAAAMRGSVLAWIIFAALAGPYIWAISRQLGHPTTGDSARLNYCFFVDQTPRWHEWYKHDLGHATGVFTHPEQVLAAPPPVFSYAAHAYGTFPLWFDPAYWTAGLTPHIWLRGHIERLMRCTELLFRFLLARPEPLVLLLVLFGFGALLPRRRDLLAWGVPVGWGLLMLGIYFPIDLQDRYLTGPYLLILLPIFAYIALPAREEAARLLPALGSGLVALLAGIAAAQSITSLAELRRHLSYEQRARPGYSEEMYPAARALAAMGIRPGDKLACFGDGACYVDIYWARLAGTQILAEVETLDDASPQVVWQQIPDPAKITAPLRAMGMKVIVGKFGNSAQKPKGWVQLGETDFFAYPLQPEIHSGTR